MAPQSAWPTAACTAVSALIGAGLLAFAADYLTGLLRPGDYWRGYPLVTFVAFYALGLVSAAAALLTIGKHVDRDRLRIAAWLLFLLMGALACLLAPGAAIYFLFPPLIAAFGILVARFHPAAEQIGSIAGALLLFVTLAEVLHLLELLLIDGPYWILAPLAVLATLPLLVEARPVSEPVLAKRVLWPALAMVILGWAAVLLVPRATADRQQLFTIEYLRDESARATLWAVSNKRVGLPEAFEAFGAWQLAEIPYSSRRRWTTAAPDLPVPAPAAEVSAAQSDLGGRRVALTLRTNGSEAVALKLPAEARLLRAGIMGRMLAPGALVPVGLLASG